MKQPRRSQTLIVRSSSASSITSSIDRRVYKNAGINMMIVSRTLIICRPAALATRIHQVLLRNHSMNAITARKRADGVSTASENRNRRSRTEDTRQRTTEPDRIRNQTALAPEQRIEDRNIRSYSPRSVSPPSMVCMRPALRLELSWHSRSVLSHILYAEPEAQSKLTHASHTERRLSNNSRASAGGREYLRSFGEICELGFRACFFDARGISYTRYMPECSQISSML